MDLIIESFRRLYHDKQINNTTLSYLVAQGVISESDIEYIKQEEGDK